MPGPLTHLRILEVEGIGPGPFAAMTLGDLGANVLRVARPTNKGAPRKPNPVLDRGRSGQVHLDLKVQSDKQRFLELVSHADALIEGFRPGVMERLGLGPEECLARNPRLIYGRVTGWGRKGPLSLTAGHDINYIALSGALHACGTAQSGPVPPLNLVGDFGGGGLLLSFGILAALLERQGSGKGQVVDAAMVDGAAMLMAMMYGMRANGQWSAPRAGNILDGSAWFYTCYACADGQWVAVGAIEMEFREVLLEKLNLEHEREAILNAPPGDQGARSRLAGVFGSRPRDHWQAVFSGSDGCVTPVLSMGEVLTHPHNQAWGTFTEQKGAIHHTPAPRFSRTPAAPPADAPAGALEQWGLKTA